MNQLVNYNEEFAKQALQYAERERLRGGQFLSTRGGVLMYGEEAMPGNQAAVIVLESVYENNYYTGAFDPNNAQAPVCYAFASMPDDPVGPHPSMQEDLSYFKPQSDLCGRCQWNKFGSADKGRGKACQNRRRLALLPAGFYKLGSDRRNFELDLINDARTFAKMDIVFTKVPVTSTENWAKYTTFTTSQMHRPPYAVITRVYLEPHPKHQFHMCFEPIDNVRDEFVPVIMAKVEEARKSIIQGYRPPQQQEAPQGSLRGLRGR